MNYAAARELADKSGWHFTVQNNSDVWTHQCCRDPGPPATIEQVEKYGYLLGETTLGLPHAPHETKEEAELCFNNWRRKPEHIDFGAKFGDWTGCVICDSPTKEGARIHDIGWPQYVALCADHRTVDYALATIDDIKEVAYS